ncbi:MAG: heme-binding protein [Caulobacteraceae bacterium]
MFRLTATTAGALALAVTAATAVFAQPAAPPPAPVTAPPAGAPVRPVSAPPYGPTITLEQAKRAAAGAEAEARKRGFNISIAIAGPTGDVVFFEHMDGALYATDDLSKLKARNSARYRWGTSGFIAMQKLGQNFPDVFVGGGGMPLVVGGRTVGAIGVSGAFDDPIAQAGVDALK